MIVPGRKLLVWVAAFIVPLAAVTGAFDSARIPAGAVLALLAGVVVADGVLSQRRLAGIRVLSRGILRLRHGADGKVDVELHNETGSSLQVRLALGLPPALGRVGNSDASAGALFELLIPAGPAAASFGLPVRGLERGAHRVATCHLEVLSRCGFWEIRRVYILNAEVRVYPDLLQERLAIAAHFLRRGGAGAHSQRQIGKGREFEKLRDFLPGDSLDDVHWKATAKRGQPVTKEYQIERTQEVYAVVDVSRLALREVDGEVAIERYLRAALVLGVATRQYNDLFGLVVFGDTVQTFLPARTGKVQFDACREAILNLKARSVAPDFSELSTFIRLRLRRRALLVVLTDLDDPALAEDFVRAADLIARRHLMMVTMVKPPSVAPIFSSPAESRNEIIENLAGHLRWYRLRELGWVLGRRGVDLALLDCESLVSDVVSRYVAVKRRQIL